MKLFNVLLRKELAVFAFGGGKGKGKDILGTVVSGLISLVFLALFVYLFVAFQSKFTALNLENEVMILFVAAAVILQIMLAVSKAGTVLYGGADAKVILPLPISNITMLAAKLTALWIKEVINSCFFILPVLVAYGIMSGSGVGYYFLTVIVIACTSLFIVSAAAIISPLFIKLKNFLFKQPVIILIISLVFLVAVFIAYSKLLGVVSEMLLGNRLRFIFNKEVADKLRSISKFAFFAKQAGDFLNGNFWGFAIIFVTAAALAVAAYFVSSKFYLAYLKANTARRTGKERVHGNKIRGETASLIVKELTEIFKNPTYLFSYLSVVLTLPVLCYLTVGVLGELVGKLLGGDFIVPFAILILVMFSCVCNTFAGDVISREENRIMIVKTIPVPYTKQVGVKVGIALVIAFVSDLLSVLILLVTGTLGALACLLVFFITFAATCASIINLVAKDINSPVVTSGGENGNVSLAVVRSLLLSCVLGGICLALHGAEIFYTGTGNAFLKGLADFSKSIGGINGIMAIALVLCLIDAGISIAKLVVNLNERMRRIRI